MKITYYLDLFSSWCYHAEPAWAELRARYAGRVEFAWAIALMNPADFPATAAQCDWFYRRSGGTTLHHPYMLSSGWVEPARRGHYEAPNRVAEAARDFAGEGDTVRLALATAALREGRQLGDLGEAVAVAARAGKIPAKKLRARAESAAVAARVAASTALFHAHQINQRPAFILEDEIGDKAVFSGLVTLAPLAAAVDAMLSDCAAYASHRAHHGSPPAV